MVYNGQGAGVSVTTSTVCPPYSEEAFGHLLSRLNDKNISEHEAVRNSLVNFFTTDPVKSTDVLMKYRLKKPRLPKEAVVVLLRAVEFVLSKNCEIPKDALEEFLIFALEELTASLHDDPSIQNPALDTLVALGCGHDCKMVMEALMAHTQRGIAQNALVFECFSKLSEKNRTGVLPFIKSIVPTLYPCLGDIKVDRLRKAKISAMCSFCKILLEHSSELSNTTQDNSQNSKIENDVITNCKTEIYAAYNSLFNQWLHSRNSDLSVDILHALGAAGSLFDEKEYCILRDKSLKPSKKLLSVIRKPDVRKTPREPIEREKMVQSRPSRYSRAEARSRDISKSSNRIRLCGAAKKRMIFYMSRGYSREEAKIKAVVPINDRESYRKRSLN